RVRRIDTAGRYPRPGEIDRILSRVAYSGDGDPGRSFRQPRFGVAAGRISSRRKITGAAASGRVVAATRRTCNGNRISDGYRRHGREISGGDLRAAGLSAG